MTKEQKRAHLNKSKEAERKLTEIIMNITKTLDLDEEVMATRLATAHESEYGRVNGLINLLVAIQKWPANKGDGKLVAYNKGILAGMIDTMTLSSIAANKGYHTFASDDLTLIEGKEPNYQDYSDYCEIFLEDLGIKDFQVPVLDQTIWRASEARAIAKATETQTLMLEAAEAYKAQM